MQLTLTIILEKPPVNVSFALQKGSGSNYQSVQLKRSAKVENLSFELSVDVKGDSNLNPEPDFKGPFVQGPVGARFIYIGIGAYAGIPGELWDRRLKIPLTGITWQMVNQSRLTTSVPGTGKDGTPTCATVKPFMGWQAE